ncbi:nipblb [Symbiodinium pilosum]|uniref:Nipblb protein n=1 Tax=Symbiodinium pilosum TaxID=2952 RepID=A0A812JX24_SYMPI|nr:nipblb [Symbiodinium pilosum]
MRSTFGSSSRDWLQDAHGGRSMPATAPEEVALPIAGPEPRYRAKRAPRCLQPTVGKEALTPAELRSRPGARGRQLPFWHSSAWSGTLREPGGRSGPTLHEVPRQKCVDPQDSPRSRHPFIFAEAKAADAMEQVKTLRLQAPSSHSSSSSSNTDRGVQFHSKDRLAKSCLKPWRSPLEALIGKSFVFPSGRRGSRLSDLMASTHKGSKANAEVQPAVASDQADHEATSHTAWEAIKKTHGFVMLCQQRL